MVNIISLFSFSMLKSQVEARRMTVKIISNSKKNQKGKNCKILMLARYYWLVQENLRYLPVASRFNPSFPWCTAISLNPSHKSQCIYTEKRMGTSLYFLEEILWPNRKIWTLAKCTHTQLDLTLLLLVKAAKKKIDKPHISFTKL